ncbi:hypothetical protein BC936DRAFT_143067 [Jimgerdemannia flammicorona]|uniref:Uncharacterized protein n=1 Tax=Jimgerdemannia flammicorona TaxID=994334 RepID=A0A433DEG7_9FUNG|nr:hypothetical protein BC936DRAFT_143067 [Jimgerdemannia flammicorona]
MACDCSTCNTLKKRKLIQLPDHSGKSSLILQLCQLGLAAVDRHFFNFSTRPSNFAMSPMGVYRDWLMTGRAYSTQKPPELHDHDDSAMFPAILWAFSFETNCQLLVSDSEEGQSYQFQWRPDNAESVAGRFLVLAYLWARPTNGKLIDLGNRDAEQRRRLDNLPTLDETELMRRLVQVQLSGFRFLYNVEWEPARSGRTGKAELVFVSRTGVFAVVVVEQSDSSAGETAESRRRERRRELEQRARKLRENFAGQHLEAAAIVAFTCTCTDGAKLKVTPVGANDRVVACVVEKVEQKIDGGQWSRAAATATGGQMSNRNALPAVPAVLIASALVYGYLVRK